jgi:hypothetical protein
MREQALGTPPDPSPGGSAPELSAVVPAAGGPLGPTNGY